MSEWDIPNWVGLTAEVGLAIGLFIIAYLSAQRDKQLRERQDKIEEEARRRHEQQLQQMTEIVQSIKSMLGEKERESFKENLATFLCKRTRQNLIKFKTLWEGYLADNMMRMGRRLQDEVGILGANLIDIVAQAKGNLPDSDADEIKKLALEYDKFGRFRSFLGDKQRFDTEGNRILNETNKVLALIENKIGSGS